MKTYEMIGGPFDGRIHEGDLPEGKRMRAQRHTGPAWVYVVTGNKLIFRGQA